MDIIIFANGDILDYSFVQKQIKGNEYIICCDGGVRHAFKMDVVPNLIIGDLDSANLGILDYYRNLNVEIQKFPIEKNDTDMALCIDKSSQLKATTISIFGGIGSRLDHTIGNIHALLHARKYGINAFLINEKNRICVIDKEIEISGEKGEIVSLIPLSTEVLGVLTQGLYYPLNNETLKIGQTRGVSNYLVLEKAKVNISSGYLIVIQGSDE